MEKLENTVSLVTGAASGIGKATCQKLALEGSNVILTDINEEVGEIVAAQFREQGLNTQFQYLDVRNEKEWKSLIKNICKDLGHLDVLVNNAGVECIKLISDLSLKDWHDICRINLDGVFLGTKYGCWGMTEGSLSHDAIGGSIINLSSTAGITGTAGQSAYNMTKGGVRLFTKSAAIEFARQNLKVRVNSVHPGIIETPMIEMAWKDWSAVGYGDTEKQTQDLLRSMHPIGRFGKPEDVANAILYLACDDSSFVTGSELVVDGGLTAA